MDNQAASWRVVHRQFPFAEIGGDQLPRVRLKTNGADLTGSLDQRKGLPAREVYKAQGVRCAVADCEQGAVRGDVEIHRIGGKRKFPVHAHRFKGEGDQLAWLTTKHKEIAVGGRKPHGDGRPAYLQLARKGEV